MTRLIYVLVILFLSFFGHGQTGEIRVTSLDSLRQDSAFDVLNEHDLFWDSTSTERLYKRVERLRSSSYFLDSLDANEQMDTLQKIRGYAIFYRENRSRFVLMEFENQQLKDTLTIDKGAKAICLYDDSSLSIITGTGIFGGLYFDLNITQDQISGLINIDEYKEAVFKANLSDTVLQNSIDVSLTDHVMWLDHEPTIDNGEILNGKLEFRSAIFYRSSSLYPFLSKNHYHPTEVNEVYYNGELEFTCKVLEPIQRVDW